MLWVPVALAVGIAVWFTLPIASVWAGFIGSCCILALVGLRLPRGGRLQMLVISGALWIALGCALIWGKALLVGEPPLSRPVFTQVEGRVLAVERQTALERVRLTIAPEGRADLPRKIRVNLDDDNWVEGIGKGARIAFRSRLMPPPPPAVPGAYDFAQRAYFMGLGATGRVLAPVTVLEPARDSTGGLRQRLVDHIGAQLGGGEGAIATTLATGDRGAISEKDAQAMRRSGLAHLLAISGLHVSALIAGVIFLVYRLLALSSRLALGWPLLLVAAGAGAAAGIGYTLLTGAQVPTVRSCIAALLVLGGLALGREAISLRLVSAGALIVLLLWPEALVGPSFQMSFAAVTVIIALAETRWFRDLTHAREEGWAMKLARFILALFITGLAVEIALMPIALFHFHQAGLLGALANLIAIPLTTFVIMPAEALALLFDVVGLGAPFWWVVGKAIGLLLGLAHGVSEHPLSVWALPHFSTGAFALIILGALWFILWRTRLRFLGLPIALAGAAAMGMTASPDVLVTGDGRHMAVRQTDGSFALLRERAGDYVRDVLAGSMGAGDDNPARAAMVALEDTPNARCSRDMCSVLVHKAERDWLVVATRSDMWVPWEKLIDICARADIIVSQRRLPAACVPRWLKLDRARLARTGGVSIDLESQRWTSVRSPDDHHPWVLRQ